MIFYMCIFLQKVGYDMIKNETIINGFIDTVGDLLKSEPVKSMKQYNHHGPISTHFHSVHVALRVYNYCVGKKMESEKAAEITRASLLHDLYLYNWYTDKHDEYHAFYHPKEAVKNIEKLGLLRLTDMQREMIFRHMFPLGKFPNSYGALLLTTFDKYCTALEITGRTDDYRKIYDEINKRIDKNA